MATMVKEKKPKKKKPKIKSAETMEEVEDFKLCVTEEPESNLVDPNVNNTNLIDLKLEQQLSDHAGYEEVGTKDPQLTKLEQSQQIKKEEATGSQVLPLQDPKLQTYSNNEVHIAEGLTELKLESHAECENGVQFKDLNTQLHHIKNEDELPKEECTPSAPIYYELSQTFEASIPTEIACNVKTKVPCLAMEEAIRIFAGQEMYVVKELSDQEEALVEVGGYLQPQHPLVDLITHLRSSLVAVERERQRISQGYREEQSTISQLWIVEKRKKNISEKCKCGGEISFLVTYDYAELQKNKLAAAKLGLESLLRDVLDSYCSHQHEAMLTYCEIEDEIGLILQRGREEIRDCLAFILQSLKCGDEFGDVYVKVLQEWAFTLASALFNKEPDMRDLLFLMHLLFRQSRSVRWVERVVCMRVDDFNTAARFVAFLDILLSQPVPESAVECREDVHEEISEAWEELDASGSSGGVGKGKLREGDLLALLNAFPIRELIASLVLLSEQEPHQQKSCWRGATAGGVLKGACGVRVLLSVVARALPQYRAYAAVHALLCRVARATLTALAALHLQSRSNYQSDIKERISAELEACFVLGFSMLDRDRHLLPTTLLSDDTVSDYCITLMSSLHVSTSRRIEMLDIETPAAMSCADRIRIVAFAAAQQRNSTLPKIVLEFLLQTGLKQKSETCKDKCETAARELIPHLLAAHTHLHTAAFYMLADISNVESIDPLSIKSLSPEKWRPTPTDVHGLLNYWFLKCPAFIKQLLHQIDCTPHIGMSLESQLVVGYWLCEYGRGRAEAEWAWSALRRLRTHRVLWGLPLDAPAPQHTDSLMDAAFALLSSQWGHLVPLICSAGVSALRRLAGARVEDAVHCLDCVLRVLALSPESISHTPEFTEVFTIILNSGPSLVQRALGRGGRSGQQMLQQLVLDQLHEHRSNEMHRAAILSTWLHALWCPALPPASRAILDVALCTARDLRTLDAHVMYVLEEGKNELVNDAVTHAYVAPLLAHGALRGALAFEVRAGIATRLLPALAQQRRVGEKIHVDNALKFIGCNLSSDELVIHRAAAAVLLAPLENPAHLSLWSLFFHLYLQRPHDASAGKPPAGPWFFCGIVKTRTLNKLKKRLQDTVTYHRNAIKELKTQGATPTEETRSDKADNLTKVDDCILPPLTLKDLRGDTDLESEVSIDHQSVDNNVESDTKVKSDTPNLISYHTAAERMVVIFEQWLNKREELRAQPHHAEISRHLTETDLDTGWSASLREVAAPSDTHSPAPGPAPALTHYEQIINALNEFHNATNRRKPVRRSSSLPDINYNDQTSVIDVVKKYLAAVDKLVASWSSEVSRVRTLDAQLWPVVGRLRTRCRLPDVKIPCSKACRPVLVKIQEHEWRLSSEAEREIKENRRSAANAVRRLAQPKTQAARVTAALIAISRRINDKNIALRVLRIMYCSVNDEKAPAHRSLTSFIKFLAERWVCSDGEACADLLHRWSRAGAHALCGALVRPERPHARQWRALYVTLLHAPLQPAAVFSYLSRFDLAYWATVVSEDERRDLLASLLEAVAKYGQYKGEEYQMLIELLGVHSGKVCLADDTLSHVSRCVRAATTVALPAAYLAHLTPLVTAHREHLHHEQLEHLLAELGDKRTIRGSKETKAYARNAYAPHIASLLRALLRIYVVALTEQSYIPENVGGRAWSAARTSWAPWVSPGLKLLADLHHYTAMLGAFVETLVQVMDDCPGIDVFLLRHAWEWVVKCYASSAEAHAPRAAVVLAQMRRLPWDRQWRISAALDMAHRVACLNLPDLSAWVGHTWSALSAPTWVAGVTYEQLDQVLPVLFQIFTSKFMQLSEQTLEEACRLPWAAMSPHVTEQLLHAYYTAYHNPAQPYHDLPHFKLVLRVSELGASCGVDEAAQSKRCAGVTVWTSRAAAPALRAHVHAHTGRLLREIHNTAPRIENYGNYLEELVCRAIVMLCMEQDASNALPVWQKWVCTCTARTRRAVMVACGTLGASHTFAPLVDTLAHQILDDTYGGGWSVVWRPLAGRPGAWAALRQQHYYAAYALLRAAPLAVDDARSAFTALAAATVNFMDNEVIISLWVCALCRVARELPTIADGEAAERAVAARDACALLAKWAGLKRSLIQVVTLQHATVPTQRHRLLCFLGLCILSNLPSTGVQSPYKEYENACQSSSSLGVNVSDIIKWGQYPKPGYLPRLAVMLFPDRKVYFEEELNLAPTDL
ncbi:ectopic P granules protein 5 homolog isoform X2 [Aricia agestis]|uniref:ectopic P granules protein 5 homolog isoform X2 n=1 Tax=Aricia agestis TaxID=91739 RepID=UPI001C20A62D|nr:ectopic P granules protein 5 homolog isoform X2 [Aricia agestis]